MRNETPLELLRRIKAVRRRMAHDEDRMARQREMLRVMENRLENFGAETVRQAEAEYERLNKQEV